MSDDVQDMYEQVTDERRLLGKLMNLIPGFRGYMEKKARREADQLLRETISARLEQSRLDLASVQHTLSRDIVTGIQYAEAIGRADNQLMGLVGKIKDAPQGYAGFFDAIKVDEDDLARIYAFDNEMLDHAIQISADIATLNKAVNDGAYIDAAIITLNENLQAANRAFDGRQEIISQVRAEPGK